MERIGYQDIPRGMFEKLMAVENFINDATLDVKLLELVRLRVSQINGCAYCVDMHHKELNHVGESELRMASLTVWKETPYYSAEEQAALDFTEKLTLVSQEGISDEVFQRLSNYFTTEQISYLTLAIAQINTWTRMMRTFRFTPGNYQISEPEKLEDYI